MHAYIRTYIHTYMHACIHAYIHTCIHTYMHACIHTYIHTYMHACIHTDVHTYVHTYMHAYIHTHINTYIRTYIHTYIQKIPTGKWLKYSIKHTKKKLYHLQWTFSRISVIKLFWNFLFKILYPTFLNVHISYKNTWITFFFIFVWYSFILTLRGFRDRSVQTGSRAVPASYPNDILVPFSG